MVITNCFIVRNKNKKKNQFISRISSVHGSREPSYIYRDIYFDMDKYIEIIGWACIWNGETNAIVVWLLVGGGCGACE